MKYYVYVYCDPRLKGRAYKYEGGTLKLKYEPFYVGQGKLPNVLRHLTCGETISPPNVRKKIIKIRKAGFEPHIFKKLMKTKKQGEIKEEKLIIAIGRLDLETGPLANKSDGPPCKNPGPKTIKVLSDIRKKQWKNKELKAGMIAKLKIRKFTKDHCDRISEAKFIFTKEEEEFISYEYDEGSNYKSLIKKYGVSYPTLYRLRKRVERRAA